jgi:hypothetical protein
LLLSPRRTAGGAASASTVSREACTPRRAGNMEVGIWMVVVVLVVVVVVLLLLVLLLLACWCAVPLQALQSHPRSGSRTGLDN